MSISGFSRAYRPSTSAIETQAKTNAEIEVKALQDLINGKDISSYDLPESTVAKLQRMAGDSNYVSTNEDGTKTLDATKAQETLTDYEQTWIQMNSSAIRRIFDQILKMYGG